ncbi:lysine ketoglutarate reductase trans-splicing-like protein [Perilla frutescens var. frutescens]|nr:lysine ketoglutarate reductase trans-splicing-like protein [Perilla frutescens var. frutescens]
MLFIIYRTTIFQYQQTEDSGVDTMDSLPRGIIEARSDLELKPLWTSSTASKVRARHFINLLAMPVGIKQKKSVDTIVRKFLSENFTIILFHYDANLDGWWDLCWSNEAIHIVALNQTKCWEGSRLKKESTKSKIRKIAQNWTMGHMGHSNEATVACSVKNGQNCIVESA